MKRSSTPQAENQLRCIPVSPGVPTCCYLSPLQDVSRVLCPYGLASFLCRPCSLVSFPCLSLLEGTLAARLTSSFVKVVSPVRHVQATTGTLHLALCLKEAFYLGRCPWLFGRRSKFLGRRTWFR